MAFRVIATILAAAATANAAEVVAGAAADEKTCQSGFPEEDDHGALLHVATKATGAGGKWPPVTIGQLADIAQMIAEQLNPTEAAAPSPGPAAGGGGGYEAKPRGFNFPGFGPPKPKTAQEWINKINSTIDNHIVRMLTFAGFKRAFTMTKSPPEMDALVGSLGMPITISLINDFPFPIKITNYTVSHGHQYSGPTSEVIKPGEMGIWHCYRTAGSQIEVLANIQVDDAVKTDLVVAAARYRVRNVFTGCGYIRGKVGWGKDTGVAYKALCNLMDGMKLNPEEGRSDYDFAIMLAAALTKEPHM